MKHVLLSIFLISVLSVLASAPAEAALPRIYVSNQSTETIDVTVTRVRETYKNAKDWSTGNTVLVTSENVSPSDKYKFLVAGKCTSNSSAVVTLEPPCVFGFELKDTNSNVIGKATVMYRDGNVQWKGLDGNNARQDLSDKFVITKGSGGPANKTILVKGQ